MKTTRVVGAGVAFVLAITFILRGQVAMTVSPAGTVSLSATNVRALASLSDAQLGEFLNVLAATPTIAAEDLPRGGRAGNFYSLAHPDWPPLPGDIWQVPVWKLNSGSGFYLLDDLDYPESSVAGGGMCAMNSPSPLGLGGDGGFTANFQPQVFTTNDLWLQVQMIDTTVSLVIHPPWNVTNGMWDLFATTNLNSYAAGLNLTNWVWVLRTDAGQTNLTVTNFSITAECYFRLGTMLDSDGDGLTDAYEKLVSHTNPNNPDTDGDGISDSDEILNHTDPLTPNPAIPSSLNIQTCPQ